MKSSSKFALTAISLLLTVHVGMADLPAPYWYSGTNTSGWYFIPVDSAGAVTGIFVWRHTGINNNPAAIFWFDRTVSGWDSYFYLGGSGLKDAINDAETNYVGGSLIAPIAANLNANATTGATTSGDGFAQANGAKIAAVISGAVPPPSDPIAYTDQSELISPPAAIECCSCDYSATSFTEDPTPSQWLDGMLQTLEWGTEEVRSEGGVDAGLLGGWVTCGPCVPAGPPVWVPLQSTPLGGGGVNCNRAATA